MKRATKKFFEVILLIIATASFILSFAEKSDGSISILWTFGWLSAFTISAIILDRMGAFDKEEDRA